MAFSRPSTLKFRVISRRDARVLLVERDHTTAEMYKLGLLLQGFSVDLAVDGEEGIQRVLRGDLPDVIVLDLGLPRVNQWVPRKDEFEMLATLRSLRLTQSIPVVALSSDVQGVDEAVKRGATQCIAKWRITPRDLANEVQSLVRRSDDL